MNRSGKSRTIRTLAATLVATAAVTFTVVGASTGDAVAGGSHNTSRIGSGIGCC